MEGHSNWIRYSSASIKPRFRGNIHYLAVFSDDPRDVELIKRGVSGYKDFVKLVNDCLDRGLDGVLYAGINESALDIIIKRIYNSLDESPIREKDRQIRRTIVLKTALSLE